MRALVFPRSELATILAARIDVALGYPRDGADRGDGRHAPRAATRTLRHAEPRAHPSRAEWAYPVDARVEPLLLPSERAAVAVLPADWFPAGVDFTSPQHPSPPHPP